MPLPRNLVAKKWSSRSPIKSRITPVNQRKAIPEKTTNIITTEEVWDNASSHSRLNSVGSEMDDIKIRLMMRIKANRIPAIAAERGDRMRWRMSASCWLFFNVSPLLSSFIGLFFLGKDHMSDITFNTYASLYSLTAT